MRTGSALASEIASQAYRLTAGVYLSEDQLATRRLRALTRTSRLGDLTHDRGVFRGPIFRRIFATDPAMGRPYVSASDLVQADIRPTEYLSRRHGALLDELALHEGMILVTCSGMNLGRAVWTRADMEGLCASHDLIRIEPDVEKVPPGYLYAFLGSRYGRVSIRQQIFGGNIKHVEPHHIANIQVPRANADVERRVHERVAAAARARSHAVLLRRQADEHLRRFFSLSDLTNAPTSTGFTAFSMGSASVERLDASHFHPACMRATEELANCSLGSREVREVARVFTPGIFKRMHVEDPQKGYPYFTGGGLFQSEPEPRGHLSRRAPGIVNYLVRKSWLLIQDAGQLDGLLGQVVRVGAQLDGATASNNLVRIDAEDPSDAAFLFLVLASAHGYRAITRNAFGSSIPHIDAADVCRMRIPWPEASFRRPLAEPILEAWREQDRADVWSAEAIALVEHVIEEG